MVDLAADEVGALWGAACRYAPRSLHAPGRAPEASASRPRRRRRRHGQPGVDASRRPARPRPISRSISARTPAPRPDCRRASMLARVARGDGAPKSTIRCSGSAGRDPRAVGARRCDLVRTEPARPCTPLARARRSSSSSRGSSASRTATTSLPQRSCRDAVVGAVGVELGRHPRRTTAPSRARLVVDPGVDDAAVVRRSGAARAGPRSERPASASARAVARPTIPPPARTGDVVH